MNRRNQRKAAKFGEKESVANGSNMEDNFNSDFAASPTHEAGSAGLVDADDSMAECAALGELGPAPTTANRGQDFRPAYTNIGSIKGFVKCPWLLLSATVRKDMITDILKICNVKHEDINIIWKSLTGRIYISTLFPMSQMTFLEISGHY